MRNQEVLELKIYILNTSNIDLNLVTHIPRPTQAYTKHSQVILFIDHFKLIKGACKYRHIKLNFLVRI